MKILVSEITSHQKNLPHLLKLFSYEYKTTCFIHKRDRSSVTEIPEKNLHVSNIPKSFIYWYFCIVAPKYKYIFLSTGPEYTKGFAGTIATLGFYFMSLLYPSKVILHIRNTNNYLPEKNFFSGKAIQKLRIASVKHIERYTFDSLLTLNYFSSKFHRNDSVKMSVIGINYSDIRFVKHFDTNMTNDKIRIGLIGRIDVKRKDYDLILNVLDQLGNDSNRFEFVILGECKDVNSKNIISKLQQYSTVLYKDTYISDEEFERLGLSCHILFAPLTDNYGYGITKETGAFGDAIYLHKKVIIPQFACTNNEFDDISFYYTTIQELTTIFWQMLGTTNTDLFSVSPVFLDKYSTRSIFSSISNNLSL